TTSIGPFNPEQVDAFEVGVKSRLFDRRVNLNVTGFWNEYDDLQVELVRPVPSAMSGQETVVANAASARTRGIELELTAQPVQALTLNVAVGYLDSGYRKFSSPIFNAADVQIGEEDLTIYDLRRAPKWTAGAGASYEADVAN